MAITLKVSFIIIATVSLALWIIYLLSKKRINALKAVPVCLFLIALIVMYLEDYVDRTQNVLHLVSAFILITSLVVGFRNDSGDGSPSH